MCKARLSDNLRAWDAINALDFVKTWIKEGIKIPFQVNSVTCTFELNNKNFNAKEVVFLDSEISRLVLLDYIEQCSLKPVCINPIHCVPKRNNSFRLITA